MRRPMRVLSITCSQRQTPAHLRFTAQETLYIEKGYNGALFYAQVKPVDDMMGEVYITPPQNSGSPVGGHEQVFAEQSVC
jgi:hypothetical protein